MTSAFADRMVRLGPLGLIARAFVVATKRAEATKD